jgi:O-antigen/teichoic acid export membrane protein
MSRSRRFIGGLAMTYGYQAIVIFVGLWLTPFYLRRIGQHDYGLWLVGTQLLTYLSLTDFGVVELLPQEVAYATGRAGGLEKTKDLSHVVGQTARLVLYQLPVVVAVVIAMFFAIPAEWHALRGPLSLILFGFVLAFPLRMLPALLQGLQDLTFAGAFQILNWTVSTAATVWMVRSGWNLFALAAGWLISQLLLTPLAFYRIWKRFPQAIPRRLPPFDLIKTKIQLGKGMWTCISQVASVLMGQTDMLIVAKLLGPAAVVPYACTCKLISVLSNQAQILMQTALPGLCEVKTGETRERMFGVLISLTHGILFLSGLIVSVVLLVNHWFVDWWVTAKQYGGLPLTLAFATTVVTRHWTTTTAFTVFCFGHQRRISLTNLADGLVTAGACLGLTILFGLPGAAVGSAVGACVISLPVNLRVIARDTGVTVRKLVVGMLGSWIWRFAGLMTVVVWIAARWSPRNLVEAAATAVATAAVYCLLMLPNVFRSPLGEYIRPMLTSFRVKYAAIQIRFSA